MGFLSARNAIIDSSLLVNVKRSSALIPVQHFTLHLDSAVYSSIYSVDQSALRLILHNFLVRQIQNSASSAAQELLNICYANNQPLNPLSISSVLPLANHTEFCL